MKDHQVPAYAGPLCGAYLLVLPTPSYIRPKYVYAPCSDIYSCGAPSELQTLHAIYRIKNGNAYFVKLYNLKPDQHPLPHLYPAVAINIGFYVDDEFLDYLKLMDEEDFPF